MRLDVSVVNPDGQRGTLFGGYEAVRPEPVPGDGPHAYFDALSARPDCHAAYSLRDAVVVKGALAPRPDVPDMAYVYPNDPDPRRQDATKITVREGQMGPNCQMRWTFPPSKGANLLVTVDYWMGTEFHANHSLLEGFKEWPFTVFYQGGVLAGGRASFRSVNHAPESHPPGGPFTMGAYAHMIGKAGRVKDPSYGGTHWMDQTTGYPRNKLPYAPCGTPVRGYAESITPFATSVNPCGTEIFIVGERWTRFWHFFERAPGEDWVSTHRDYIGQTMAAYKWSVWYADTEREAQMHVEDAVVGMPMSAHDAGAFTHLQMQMGSGNANLPSKYAGRGDLVGYARNLVILAGTSKSDVLALLQRPE